MNNPQKQASPEIGPRNLGVPVDTTVGKPNGVIVFNQSSVSSEDPMAIINKAITDGDTMEKRTEKLLAAVQPEQK